jgi:hypothetical protein
VQSRIGATIVLGPSSKLEYVRTDAYAAPPLPTRLVENDNGVGSLCVPFRAIPSWEDAQGLRSYGDLMIDLGMVKQNCTNMQKWVPRVHQLRFRVGTLRTGQAVDKRNKKKEADTIQKNRTNDKKQTTWAQRDDGLIRWKGSIQKGVGKWSRFPQGALRRSCGAISCGAIDLEDDDI